MSQPSITPDSLVRSVMAEHPETVAVFVRRRMHCPGCAMSPFMTLAEAARSHALDAVALVDDLNAACEAREAGRR